MDHFDFTNLAQRQSQKENAKTSIRFPPLFVFLTLLSATAETTTSVCLGRGEEDKKGKLLAAIKKKTNKTKEEKFKNRYAYVYKSERRMFGDTPAQFPSRPTESH